MNALERAGYLAHSKTERFSRSLERANALIREMLWRREQPYVAFSCGKDSSVLLWLVLQHRPNITARILTSGETRLLYPDIDDVLRWWREGFPSLHLEEVLVDRVFTPEWSDVTWTQQRKAGRRDILQYLPQGRDGVFLGLRDAESNRRRMATRKMGPLRQYRASRRDNLGETWVCCPLASWTTKDVFALLTRENIPLLQAYGSGEHAASMRTTMRLTGDAVRQNAFVELRMRDKAAYNKLLSRFHELERWNG